MTDHTDDPFAHLMPRLRKRARRLSRTPEEAEDLAQETALRLWQGMERARNIENPEHYAMITLHNLARQRWRTRRPTEELAEDMAQQPPAAPARLACAEASWNSCWQGKAARRRSRTRWACPWALLCPALPAPAHGCVKNWK